MNSKYKPFLIYLPLEKLNGLREEAKENSVSISALIRLKLFNKNMGVAQ